MIDVDYPRLLELFPQHLDSSGKRSESASFLIWYLEHYYRLDTLEAIDSVCDQRGDKGVDGIFVNDNNQTITIFQSRISQRNDRTIGDQPLRELVGTMAQFQSPEAIQELISTANKAQVAQLATRLGLVEKVRTHEVRGEFVSNIDIDANGQAFLNTVPDLTFVGKTPLTSTYISDSREIPVQPAVTFDIHGLTAAEYIVDAGMKAIIVPVKAVELVAMNGIADQSIFAYNVRGPLGRTQVNRDIAESIGDRAIHKMFPLFHNGITVIAKELEATNDTVTAGGYFVVNGCQSLTALFNGMTHLTDDLRVLVKFIKADPTSPWAEKITRISNNQNGVRPRDFKANSQIQIRLQNEMRQLYGDTYSYEIKRGDVEQEDITVISNEDAGLYLRAFDLKEPWATHRKYEVFEDKHADLFGRPEVTADRIVLLQVVMEAVSDAIPNIENQLVGRYVLTKYLIMYIVHEILECDQILDDISRNPSTFVREETDRAHFRHCIDQAVDDIVGDLNDEMKAYEEDFDYRDKLRDSDWVSAMSRRIVGDHRKLVSRGKLNSFKMDWEARNNAE